MITFAGLFYFPHLINHKLVIIYRIPGWFDRETATNIDGVQFGTIFFSWQYRLITLLVRSNNKISSFIPLFRKIWSIFHWEAILVPFDLIDVNSSTSVAGNPAWKCKKENSVLLQRPPECPVWMELHWFFILLKFILVISRNGITIFKPGIQREAMRFVYGFCLNPLQII